MGTDYAKELEKRLRPAFGSYGAEDFEALTKEVEGRP